MSIPTWPAKDPDEVLDYRIDWSPKLDGDVIVESVWELDSGSLIIQSQSFDSDSTKVWLAGGIPNYLYALTNTITTADGRIFEEIVALPIIDSTTPTNRCSQPSIGEFRVRFPEFVDVEDESIQISINDASCWVDSSWISERCNNCTTAMTFLAAHYLALQLEAASNLPEIIPDESGNSVIAGGQLTSLHFESMSASFSSSKSISSGGGSGGSGIGDNFDWGSTYYGQRFIELLKVNKPAVAVV